MNLSLFFSVLLCCGRLFKTLNFIELLFQSTGLLYLHANMQNDILITKFLLQEILQFNFIFSFIYETV